MTRLLRLCLALGAFFVSALLIAACGGGGIPGNAVVKVGGNTISKDDFNHWLKIAAVSSQGQAPGQAADPAKAQIPMPPDFAACIANAKKTAPKPAKGQPRVTDAQYKAQCKQQYESLRDQVLQFLISAEWISGEASDQGIKLSDADIQKAFAKTKKQSFPKEADYQKFLKSSGMNQKDILFRVKLDTLSNKLRAKVTKGKDQVTDAQISAYYAKNKARFAQPERRDLRLILTKTKAKADQAKAAISGGQSWKTVAKKFSTDQASKNQGGVLLAVAKGQQEKALDTAVFGASPKKLSGPVKTQFGYYVFMVTKVTKASQQSIAQSKPTIKQLLASQNQQKSLDTFVKGFRKKWTAKTNCRKDFATMDCKNFKKPKTSTTPGAPGVPQQGGAPPVPQQGGAPPTQGGAPPTQGGAPPTQGGAPPVPQQGGATPVPQGGGAPPTTP